jgi:hypothetical protein
LITFGGNLNTHSREAEAARRVINDVLAEHERPGELDLIVCASS